MVTNTTLGTYVRTKEQSDKSRLSHSGAGLLPPPARVAEGPPREGLRSPSWGSLSAWKLFQGRATEGPVYGNASDMAQPSCVRAWVRAHVGSCVCVVM